MNFTNNIFVQAVGVGAVTWLFLRGLAWGLEAGLRVVETFSQWYRYQGLRWADEASIAIGLVWLLIAAVASSRES